MAVPVKYRRSPPINLSFDWTDVSSGVGYVRYYGYSTQTDSGVSYSLDTNAIWSDEPENGDSYDPSSAVDVKVFEADFETSEFAVSRTMKGTAIVNMTAGFIANSSMAGQGIYLKASLYKYDGATETQIGSTIQTKDYDATSSNAWKSESFTIPIDISSPTPVAKGDLIRLTIEVWGKSTIPTGISNFQVLLAHSPTNTADSLDPSTQDSEHNQLIIYIPFDLEL